MNSKLLDKLSSLCFDLMKVPLAVCVLAPVMAEHEAMPEGIFFGACFALFLLYVGCVLEVKSWQI